jgi:acyl-CoA synthetase (AMP-forming)/AMP-acid ligase II
MAIPQLRTFSEKGVAMTSIPDEPVTIPQVLDIAAARWPEAPALVQDDQAITYAELLRAARATAGGLVARGVEPGERVGIWLPNGEEWAVAAYGVAFAGAVAVPLGTRHTVAGAADVIERAGCSVVIASGRLLGRDLGADALRAGARKAIATADLAVSRTGADREVQRRARELTADSISHVQYTSGTTGRPKGALLRHGALVATTRSWVEITGLRSGDIYPVVAPFAHVAGHKTGLLACAVAGAAALPVPVFDAAGLMAGIHERKATFLQGPPTMFQDLLAAPGPDPTSVRVAVTGATVVPPTMVRALRARLGIRSVFAAYGLTEASGVVTMTRADDPPDAAASTSGAPIPGVRVQIAGDAHSGEILVSGVGLMAGYLDDPQATADVLRNGWLHTGDVGEVDRQGRLRVVGRLKDLVIVGGLNLYPAEVEDVLTDHPAVRAAAVVGMPDERLGEVAVAFAVGDGNVSATDVLEFCRKRLAGFKTPRVLWWIDELPVNAVGKVDKVTLGTAAARRSRSTDRA